MKQWVGILLGAVLAVGCGKSPLLHHAEASNMTNNRSSDTSAPDAGSATADTNNKCPIEFSKNKLCASITWVKEPVMGEEPTPGEFTLRFWKKADATPSGPYTTPTQTVAVKLWMPEHGHGSTPVKIAQAKDQGGQLIDGVYNVTQVNFVMSGKWEIQVQLKKDNRVEEQAKPTYEVK